MLDTAHCSDESAQALIYASTKPVIDSHTSSSDFVPPCRGLRDETLRMIARSGGVVGVRGHDVQRQAPRQPLVVLPILLHLRSSKVLEFT